MNFSRASMSKTDSQHFSESSEVKAQPFVGGSLDNTSDDSDNSVDRAFQAMQRAMVRWDIFGTFDCAAEYTLAKARWLRVRSQIA